MNDKEKEMGSPEGREIVDAVKQAPLANFLQLQPQPQIEFQPQVTSERTYATTEAFLDHMRAAARHTTAAFSLGWGALGVATSTLCSYFTADKGSAKPYFLAFSVAFLFLSAFGFLWWFLQGESVPKLIDEFKRNAKPLS